MFVAWWLNCSSVEANMLKNEKSVYFIGSVALQSRLYSLVAQQLDDSFVGTIELLSLRDECT